LAGRSKSREWNEHTAPGTAVEVREKIVAEFKVALGPSANALAIITSAIDVLKAMRPIPRGSRSSAGRPSTRGSRDSRWGWSEARGG